MSKSLLFCVAVLVALAASEYAVEEVLTKFVIPKGSNRITVSCNLTNKQQGYYVYVTSCFGKLKYYLSEGAPLDPDANQPTDIPTSNSPGAIKWIPAGRDGYLVVVAENVDSEYYKDNTAVVNVLCTNDKTKFNPSYGQKAVTPSINLNSGTATLTYTSSGEENYVYAIYRHEFLKSEYKSSLHCPPPNFYFSDCSSALWMTPDYNVNSHISFNSGKSVATITVGNITKPYTTLAGVFYANRTGIPKTFLTYIALNGSNTVAPFLLLALSALLMVFFL